MPVDGTHISTLVLVVLFSVEALLSNVGLWKKILSPLTRSLDMPPVPPRKRERETRPCYCTRCDGKRVSNTTYYRHNPGRRGAGKHHTEVTPLRGTPCAVSSGNVGQCDPSLIASGSGPSNDTMSEDGTDLPDIDRVNRTLGTVSVVAC